MKRTLGAILLCLISGESLAWESPPRPSPGSATSSPSSAAIDEAILGEMRKRHVPGLSLAVIQGGKIVKATAYGVTEEGGVSPVTTSTLFQAGSVSKSVAASAALRLVERGKLSLDDDVNTRLTTWKVPENEFTKTKKVTLRGLVSHTAGLTVHGFPGYPSGAPVPTLVQILDGVKPATTEPIRVDCLPGSRWRYSGGGYTVMQQMIVDVTGEPFPKFMRDTVLESFGMKESTFEQPLPPEKAGLSACGHDQARGRVKGRWHIYPEMAAAGLWTTPSDLAHFAIGVQEALEGKSDKVLSRSMARQMLTSQKNDVGLGVFLEGSGHALRFGHNGRDRGFDARLIAYAETGQGAAIMINANDNSGMLSRIVQAIAREYHWPDYPLPDLAQAPAVAVAEDQLLARAGYYEFASHRIMTLATGPDRLQTVVDGLPDEDFLPETDDRYRSTQHNARITFIKDASGEIREFVWKENDREWNVPRIGPLFTSLEPRTDPDPRRTETIVATLGAIQQGGKFVADTPALTPGARDVFGKGSEPEMAGLQSLRYLAEQDVSGRKIQRHKSEVGRIVFFQMVTDKANHCLLIHLTADGTITDYDIVRAGTKR
ncbi:serine hydrolase domain-containing protein [Singulisphaera rosea]